MWDITSHLESNLHTKYRKRMVISILALTKTNDLSSANIKVMSV